MRENNMRDIKRIEIIKRLNFLEMFILDNAYYSNDEEKSIIKQVYKGLNENELKSLLAELGEIIESVKELEYYD